MKKYLLLVFTLCILGTSSRAAVGDTTWVQANITNLEWYGTFDTTVNFPAPGTTFRKVYMIFTLGKHMCPGYTYGTGSVPWCGDWDYTVLNYLMTPAGDTLELARLITPYANAGAPRTPYTWQQDYVYDVTDYATLMHDSATMRILYSGYSGGFTASVKFAFIEGTPDRNVLKVRRLWTGSYGYGDTTHLDSFDINTHFTARTDTVPAGTVATDVKFLVTGHGSDANGCCEFAAHNYRVMLNGTAVDTRTIWRDNCGSNELYPQSGTWLYQRGNWCPGALVYPNYHLLPGLTPGTGFDVALQFDSYVGSGGSYTTEGHLIYYGAMNKTLDASLDDIIAPTSDQNHFRENPTSDNPVVHVKNTGENTITSILFRYGVAGYAVQTYSWTGTMAALQESDISLPLLSALDSLAGVSGTYSFTCTILEVNGGPDNDGTNNTMTSSFVSAPVWPARFRVTMRTNNEGTTENSWIIYDMHNNIVSQRAGGALNTTYRDTVILPKGCYRIQVYDSSCDGLNWWNFGNYTPVITSGYVTVGPIPGTLFTLHGDVASGTYNNDFGCGFTQYFYVATDAPPSLAISDLNADDVMLDAFPNPAKNVVNVEISGLQNVHGHLELTDMTGRVVVSELCTDTHQQLNVSSLANGMYLLMYVNDATGSRVQTKIVITK